MNTSGVYFPATGSFGTGCNVRHGVDLARNAQIKIQTVKMNSITAMVHRNKKSGFGWRVGQSSRRSLSIGATRPSTTEFPLRQSEPTSRNHEDSIFEALPGYEDLSYEYVDPNVRSFDFRQNIDYDRLGKERTWKINERADI